MDFSFIVNPEQPRAYYQKKLKEFKARPIQCVGKCVVCDGNRQAVIRELTNLIAEKQVA